MQKGGLAWRGYFPVGGELTMGKPDQKEGIYFGRELAADHPAVIAKTPLHGMNLWPDGSLGRDMKATVTQYMTEVSSLAQHASCRLVGTGLGLDE